MTLIDSLIKNGWLKTPRIIEAFQRIKREDFLSEDMKNLAELDEALSIGWGQTISQPLVVAFMMELLKPDVGDKILDIGSGSGWTNALLAHIVSGGELKSKVKKEQVPRKREQKSKINGRVIAIEVIPELMEFGKKNVAKYNFIEKGIAEFVCADGSKGYPNFATRPELAEGFDKILASASVQDKIPEAWKEQLKIGGRIVTPIKNSIWLFIKKSPTAAKALVGKENDFEEKEYPGFLFVPLIEK